MTPPKTAAKKGRQPEYTAQDITVLKGLQPVRQRPLGRTFHGQEDPSRARRPVELDEQLDPPPERGHVLRREVVVDLHPAGAEAMPSAPPKRFVARSRS